MFRDDPPVNLQWPLKFNEIPKEVFQREDIYRRELERIFRGPEWHLVAHRAEVAEPGGYKSTFIGETPILIVHGEDGKVRVFSNSCTHRGVLLKNCGRGVARELNCPYHRWAFNLQGEMTGAPGIKDFPPDFAKENYGLRQLRYEEFHGLVFATFSREAPPLDEYLGETKPYLIKAVGGDRGLKLLGYQKVIFDANWKEYNDNDGYHGPLLHTAFRLLQWPKGQGVQFVTAQAHKVNSVQFGGPPTTGFLKDATLVESRDKSGPPSNTVIVFYPLSQMFRNLDVVNIRYAFPLSPHQTEVHYAYFSQGDDDAAMAHHRVRQASNLLGPSGFISLEDGAVFNRAHIGSRTAGTVAFQKGFTGPIQAPIEVKKDDESSNLIRWERYRQSMGFDRG